MKNLTFEELERIIREVLDEAFNKIVNETPRLPPAVIKKRAERRKKETEEREEDAAEELKKLRKKEEYTKPYKEIWDDFKSFANGIMEDEELEEAGKKKPACGGVRGSALYHDENGHFTGKKTAKVRSLKKYSGSDCRHGTTRVKGNNDSIATKLPCGSERQTSAGGEGKEDVRCKDGKPS